MGSMQVVFLFDLNACADFLLRPKEELSKRLLSVRLVCLRLLSDFSAKSPSLKWGFKFFDSHGSKTQTMCKFAFPNMSLENFETLENEICVRYERHVSILRALIESSENSATSVNYRSEKEVKADSPVKVLQFALTQILCEFQWETMDMWSPSATKIKNGKRNFLFVFSDFKDSDELLFEYFGLNSSFTKPKFMNTFLPQSLRDSLLKKADIHLVLLNMCEDQKFMGSFSSKILPLLSVSLHSIQGSFIPLCILSQPLYNMRLLNDLEKTMCQDKESISNLPRSYHNSFIPFSTLFEQSLCHPFYSTTNTLYKCCIDFSSKDLQIPIQIMEISNKKSSLCGDVNVKVTSSVKNKCTENYRIVWSKFNAHCAVPRSAHFPAYKIILCLPSYSESSACETSSLQELTRNLSVDGVNLLLECVTEDGLKVPGFLTPLSSDAAVISVLDPAINFLNLKASYRIPATRPLKYKDFENDCSNEIQNFCGEKADLHGRVQYAANSHDTALKPFKMECLEPWFKPINCGVASYIESKSSNNPLAMGAVWKLLKRSVRNDNSLKSKHLKYHLNYESESISVDQSEVVEEKLLDDQSKPESEIKDVEELPSDLSHEELLSAIRDVYNSAIEPSGNIISASERIMKMMINYCKKHSNTYFEEDVNTMFKENFLMTARRISEKYEMFDSEEARGKEIKECQIQILLSLEVESLRICPDKSNCVNTITSLLGFATICYSKKGLLRLEGLKELKTFLQEGLKKNHSHTLSDILLEIGDEYDYIRIFDDSESTSSPAETVSSEFNNDDELFSSVISSTMSVKSSSSTSSRNDYKENKDKNTLERQLLRRRSDISDTSRYRQVLLPKSSPKKKKAKIVANKALRYSPRLAAKRNDEHAKSTCEKPSKVRRNLFSGEKACRTPKKNNNQPSTPKSKRRNYISKTKLAAETPSHKQNYSALQRRKYFIDQLSKSPKVIAESPKIRKTAKDGANKELLEKLQKASQQALKTSNKTVKDKPKLPSFKEYTPESKRRLSLKLFSKLLSGPTARQGIKKCTKRLFDHISPEKAVGSSKRHKSNGKCEMPSNSFEKNETQS